MSKHKYTRKRKTHSSGGNFGFVIVMIIFTIVLCCMVFRPVENSTPGMHDTQQGSVSQKHEEGSTEPETTPEPEVDPIAFELHQIDVGCANAYLLRYDGHSIFIDGGQSFGYKTVSNYLDNLGVAYIDMYIATHWHGDHVSNMSKILEKYAHPATVVYGPSERNNSKYPVSKGTYSQLVAGDTFNIGEVTFTCVGPYEVKQSGNSNPDSLNFVIEYGDFKVLMTGDYMYNKVIEQYPELTENVDVLQMPHHGLDPLCISEKAFAHCNPEIVLVPANSSAPTKALVRDLKTESKVLDNQSGCIAIVSYGDGFRVYTGVIASDFEY